MCLVLVIHVTSTVFCIIEDKIAIGGDTDDSS